MQNIWWSNEFIGRNYGWSIDQSQQFYKKDMKVEDIWDLGVFKDCLAWSKVQEKFQFENVEIASYEYIMPSGNNGSQLKIFKHIKKVNGLGPLVMMNSCLGVYGRLI